MPATPFARSRHALAALAVFMAAAGSAAAAGLDIHADADAADVGVPAYPGAVKKAETSGDPSGFSFGIWGQSFGIKLAVVSYRSSDGVDKVAAFYRDALAKYGPVLDCSRSAGKPDAAPKSPEQKKADHDKPVTCGDDTIEPGGRLYKVGTNGAQRVFKATPWHEGAKFELLRIEQHGTD